MSDTPMPEPTVESSPAPAEPEAVVEAPAVEEPAELVEVELPDGEPRTYDLPNGPLYACRKCHNLLLEVDGVFVRSADPSDATCPGTGGAHEVD